MKLLYAISSHVRYTTPSEQLIQSFIDARGLQLNDILIVFGGAEESKFSTFKGVPAALVTHNSFDMTAAIELVTGHAFLKDFYTHVCLLHDTMLVGPNTETRLQAIDPMTDVTAAWGGQCNLMVVRYDYLIERKNDIVNCMNCTKLEAINHEGFLFKTCPDLRRVSLPGTCTELGRGRPYDGAERVREYYSAFDVTKWKANYGQTRTGTYILEA